VNKQKPLLCFICSTLAHAGFVCAHAYHEPGLAALYALLLFGHLVEWMTSRTRT
jgi:hypothetical protein